MYSNNNTYFKKPSTAIIFLAFIFAHITACNAKEAKYKTQKNKRELIASGVISLPDRHEFGTTLTSDGSEIFIGIEHGNWASIVSYKHDGKKWQGPNKVIGSETFSANDPMLSPDQKHLYFISKQSGQYDIGYLTRENDGGWSTPNWLPAPINSKSNEYYISLTKNGDLVFSTDRKAKQGNDFDIVRARKGNNGEYDLETLPSSINTIGYEADAFIDPNGQYLIFSSSRPGGLGRGDLYISFLTDNKNWSDAVPLDDSVNTTGHELCPFVSADGQWLYFTSDGDIYRISTDKILTSPTQPKKRTNPSHSIEEYISVNTNSVLLKNATLHIGDGTKSKTQQSILIQGKKIAQIGPDNTLKVPENTHVIDVKGGSVMPGIIGMHNHTHTPGKPLLKFIAPRLYLAGGVTTMTTAGSVDTLGELEMVNSINSGEVPGPTIYPSAHYISGPKGNAPMTKPASERDARAYVQNWAKRGVTWFKLYRHTQPNIAAAVINEAHSLGLKVAGHLCSITFQEAAEMGIDSIEHGLNSATDFVTKKGIGECVPSRASKIALSPDSDQLNDLIQTLISHNVTITSTLAILETGFPYRPQADKRSLALMTKIEHTHYDERQKKLIEHSKTTTSTPTYWSLLLSFERNFVKAGGLLVAGADPGRHVYPGYGDQRNFELLVEAGFSIDQAIKIMTSNGAKTLEIENRTGLIKPGYEADLLVIDSSLNDHPKNIRNIKLVFKDGLGYNPTSLVESVKNHIHSK